MLVSRGHDPSASLPLLATTNKEVFVSTVEIFIKWSIFTKHHTPNPEPPKLYVEAPP